MKGTCDSKFQFFDLPYISSEAISIVCSNSDAQSTLKRSILDCWESEFGGNEKTLIERHCSRVTDDPFRQSSVTSFSTWLHPPSLFLVCVLLGLAVWVWSVRNHNRPTCSKHDCIERHLALQNEDTVYGKTFISFMDFKKFSISELHYMFRIEAIECTLRKHNLSFF